MTKPTTTPAAAVDSEVKPPRRRTFTREYKERILAEVDAVTEPGGVGAILRREGLYSSHIVDWRQRRARGLAPRKTGRPAKAPETRELEQEVARLRRDKAQLEARLRRAEIIVEAQKKLSEALALLQSSTDLGEVS